MTDSQAPELVADDFVAIMAATRLCVLIHDAETKNILWANPAACEMLEWSVSELRPLKANDMSSSAQQYDRVIGRAWLQEAVDNGVSRIEWHYRTRSGRVIPTDALAIRVELAQGPAVMVQFRDIEHEQQVERDLRLTTSYVDALAHHTSTVALMLDAAGNVRFATDTAVALIGADLDEPLGHVTRCGRLRSDGQAVEWREIACRAAPVAAVQLEIPRADRDPIWLEGSLERLKDPDGEAMLMILHDVSDRIQEEVRRERELHRENYLARYNAMGDMAMAIAHELGQPLAAAGNFLAGVRARAPESADLLYGIDSVERQIERASAIVNAVRAFVGHLEHIQQVVDLNAIVEECLYFVRLRAAPLGVDVNVRFHPHPVMVRCERVLTGQVVLNLCFNAIDEMAAWADRPRAITISTSVGQQAGVVTVDDQGRGIPHDPFEESFTSKTGGSGIGLALSYRIITRQHGTIWAERLEKDGSRFGFTLPLSH
ncbi:PAS domain-containing sensor histidine kinase [Nocardia nova]|uniref:histidine kinase n=2 Tax=Nocardia nova TaxID=37330 RepID=A0A2S6AKM7_9NOCA|nr:PAS domain-containing sensor histidine kinase [Nocardia nova]PPJ35753.1 PAS domain-containing sensor histidine kinase [Nocardia nova]